MRRNGVLGTGVGRLARQLQRVTGKIGVPENFIALVMMAEYDDPLAESCLRTKDALLAILVVE